MKLFLTLLLLFAIGTAKYEELKECINERCPSEYDKCMAKSGCEEQLQKCADKCGLQVNQICWAGCVGIFGPASAAALCAVNKGCIDNTEFNWEEIGKKIDELIKKD